MKVTIILLTTILFTYACVQSSPRDNGDKQAQAANSTSLSNLFTLADAEKILGEPAHLADSSTKREGDALRYQCAYKANAEDVKSSKTGNVYFLAEEYNEVSSAQKKYAFIKKANENHGIKTLDDVGDEAYFHSDNQNFYFIMVRKGAKVFNMKVNKITSKTSLDGFNSVARKMTTAL
jgi:hypothetical protein